MASLSDADEEVSRLRAKVDHLTQALGEGHALTAADMNALHAQNESLSEQVSRLAAECHEHKQANRSLEASLAELSSRIDDGAAAALEETSAELQRLKAGQHALSARAQELEQDNELLNVMNQENETRREQLDQEVEELHDMLGKARDTIEMLQKSLQAEGKSNNPVVKDGKTLLGEIEDRRLELEARHKMLEGRHSALQRNHKQAQHQQHVLRNQIGRLSQLDNSQTMENNVRYEN